MNWLVFPFQELDSKGFQFWNNANIHFFKAFSEGNPYTGLFLEAFLAPNPVLQVPHRLRQKLRPKIKIKIAILVCTV